MSKMTSLRPIVRRDLPPGGDRASLEDVEPLLARLYSTRGVVAAQELDYGLSRLAPIGSLENVQAAVDLLLANRKRRIIVVGDFDVKESADRLKASVVG